MKTEKFTPAGKRGLGWLCLGYVVVMMYSSTVIGPAGLHFVFQDPSDALQRFLATRFVVHGSDQRADWIGNLLMLVPFGFLVTATIWPRRKVLRLPAAIAALLICTVAILGIKYLQLFFPPRTVTLNYITAQCIGAAMGCAGCIVWHGHIGPSVSRRDPVAALVVALRLYAGALLIFLLMPLDFALSAADLQTQLARLPDTLLALPGADRPLPIQLTLIATAAAGFIPVGMLLSFVKVGVFRIRRGVAAVTLIGLLLTSGIFVLTTLVMSAAPSMAAILYRTAGIMIGAASIRWAIKGGPVRSQARIRAWVPWLIIPYLIVLIGVNRLWSVDWLSARLAAEQVYCLGLLPLFDYYIVTKAEAARNIVGHVAMYLPIGFGLWFRDPRPRTGLRAFVLAALLSCGVELGRYLRPGLEGDINAIVVAGVSAMLATWLMPMAWSMLTQLSRQSIPAPVRAWQGRGGTGGSDVSGQTLAKVEHF
jgi:glycopeptide antibiotics resistance protein